jgi:hypothetical protein
MAGTMAAKAWTGANGNVVIEAQPCTIYGFTYKNAGAGSPLVSIFDNATTNSGTLLFQTTLAAATVADTIVFPEGLRALNGITINAAADLTAPGTVYVA